MVELEKFFFFRILMEIEYGVNFFKRLYRNIYLGGLVLLFFLKL